MGTRRAVLIDDEPYVDTRKMAELAHRSCFTMSKYARTGVVPARKHGKDWEFQPNRVLAVMNIKFGNSFLRNETQKALAS